MGDPGEDSERFSTKLAEWSVFAGLVVAIVTFLLTLGHQSFHDIHAWTNDVTRFGQRMALYGQLAVIVTYVIVVFGIMYRKGYWSFVPVYTSGDPGGSERLLCILWNRVFLCPSAIICWISWTWIPHPLLHVPAIILIQAVICYGGLYAGYWRFRGDAYFWGTDELGNEAIRSYWAAAEVYERYRMQNPYSE